MSARTLSFVLFRTVQSSSRCSIVLFVLFFVNFCASAQRMAALRVNDQLLESKWNNKAFADSASLSAALNRMYVELLNEGFVDARMDTARKGEFLEVNVVRGRRYGFGNTTWRADSVRTDLLLAFQGPLNSTNLQEAPQKVLIYLENHGYPFASVGYNGFTLRDSLFDVQLTLNNGPRIMLDSVVVRSDDRLPLRFLLTYLGIQLHTPYDESQLARLPSRLREIAFVEVKATPEVVFKDHSAILYLTLAKKKANYFNGIMGVRPNDQTGKVTITGDVEVKLLNAMNAGDEVQLNWRRLQPQTQDLFARFALPFIGRWPIGPDASIRIYRRDSTFSSVKANAGLVFQLGNGNSVKVFTESMRNSSNLAIVTANSTFTNTATNTYGVALAYQRLDYKFNPRKGWSFFPEVSFGRRRLNAAVADEYFQAGSAFNRILKTEGRLEGFIPTWAKQCLRLMGQGGGIFTDRLADNEMFRIGGLRTLRGISEETIFASSWTVATVEYRWLFEQNSALYVFADQAWYEQRGRYGLVTDTPLGFGAGINFQTRSGIFTFNYALNKQFDDPILVRNAKVSFGFVNIF